eukprot:2215783-Amphidinium_carterae.1
MMHVRIHTHTHGLGRRDNAVAAAETTVSTESVVENATSVLSSARECSKMRGWSVGTAAEDGGMSLFVGDCE